MVGFVYMNSNVMWLIVNVGYLFGDEMIELVMGLFVGGMVVVIKYQNFEVNGKYQFMLVCFVGVQYVYMIVCYDMIVGSVKLKIYLIGLMVDYVLFRCIDVYLMGVYQWIVGDVIGLLFDYVYVLGVVDLLLMLK